MTKEMIKQPHSDNNNRCEECTTSVNVFNYEVADTGQCGQCLHVKECIDRELIAMYRANGLTDDLIFRYLPRLRRSHIGSEEAIDELALRRQVKIVAEQTRHSPQQVESDPLFSVANEVLVNYFNQDTEVTNFVSNIIEDLDTGDSYQITMQRLKGVSAIESYNEAKSRIEALENTIAELYLLIKNEDISTKNKCVALCREALLGDPLLSKIKEDVLPKI